MRFDMLLYRIARQFTNNRDDISGLTGMVILAFNCRNVPARPQKLPVLGARCRNGKGINQEGLRRIGANNTGLTGLSLAAGLSILRKDSPRYPALQAGVDAMFEPAPASHPPRQNVSYAKSIVTLQGQPDRQIDHRHLCLAPVTECQTRSA